jgi:hypothetical protein
MHVSDWRETAEVQEGDSSQEAKGERLSPEGVSRVQGSPEKVEHKTPAQPDDPDDFITVHPRKNLETLPSPEVEPITVKNPEGGKPEPPEGWHPGGPEGGG